MRLRAVRSSSCAFRSHDMQQRYCTCTALLPLQIGGQKKGDHLSALRRLPSPVRPASPDPASSPNAIHPERASMDAPHTQQVRRWMHIPGKHPLAPAAPTQMPLSLMLGGWRMIRGVGSLRSAHRIALNPGIGIPFPAAPTCQAQFDGARISVDLSRVDSLHLALRPV
jgi:hypothetical protein